MDESCEARDFFAAISAGEIRDVELLWPDHTGHPRGKLIPAGRFELGSLPHLAFCDAALCWDFTGEIQEAVHLANWATGYPDLLADPDFTTFRPLPWRPSTGLVMCDVRDHSRELIQTAPRTVLRRAIEQLAGLGYEALVGVELEFYLLSQGGGHLTDGVQCYSLQTMNELDYLLADVMRDLEGFVECEGATTEYGPAQCEINLKCKPALEAADQATRFKYAVRELVRRRGALATFMAKPFGDLSGSSMHLHISLWKDGMPAFAPEGGRENALMSSSVGGVLAHLPGIALYGAPTVNSYKRYEPQSFAPTTATWGGDNRTCAIRSLIEPASATRIELRTGGADAQPHWAIAALIAAVILGVAERLDPGPRGDGNLYGVGDSLPLTLADAVRVARADERIQTILGFGAVHDYTTISLAEWRAFTSAVTEWDRERYLTGA